MRSVDLAFEPGARAVLLRTSAEMLPILDKIEAYMRLLGYPSKDIFAVKLVLGEAVCNAIRHGNRGDHSKHVHVGYLVLANEVFMEVQDQGQGFDPTRVPDPLVEERVDRPSGRGLFLMRVYTSWLSYNAKGNRVTLCRRRSVPA
jgi:serine/threonine-protein kinase RsbW